MLYLGLLIFVCLLLFFFNDTATTEIYTLSLHDALPIYRSNRPERHGKLVSLLTKGTIAHLPISCQAKSSLRSEEHTSELQSLRHLVCRLLLQKKNCCSEPRMAEDCRCEVVVIISTRDRA